jgi:hypothetical protein
MVKAMEDVGRQEREMMECNKSNGNQLYVGSRRRDDGWFPEEKDNFLFQLPTQSRRGCEELESWKFKRF